MTVKRWGDREAYAALLHKCWSLAEGRALHAEISSSLQGNDTFLANLLVRMYARCGSIEEAQKAFSEIQYPNTVSGNIMIAAYALNGHLQAARMFFNSMLQRNVITWTTMLSSYTSSGLIKIAEKIFEKIPSANAISWNAMLTAYAQVGDVLSASDLFKVMPERDLASWNGLSLAFANAKDCDGAQEVFEKVPGRDIVCSTEMARVYAQAGRPDLSKQLFHSIPEHNIIACNVMINIFSQSGLLEEAEELFNETPQRIVSTWNTLIQAYGQNGLPDSACEVFKAMPQHDSVSWTVIAAAHAEAGRIQDARAIAEASPERTLALSNLMLQAYAHSGYMDEAEEGFRSMSVKDAASWTAMICGYAQSGHLDQARELFEEMPQKDLISWTSVVTTYAQRGYMDTATRFFIMMPCWDSVVWNSIIVAFGENGDFDASKYWFDQMPGLRNAGSWSAVIDAAAENERVEEAKKMFVKSPTSDAPVWNSMLRSYVKAGRIEEARELFDEMPVPNSTSWSIMINAHLDDWPAKDLIRNLCRMDLEGSRADEIMFAAVIEACGCQKAAEDGRKIHSELELKAASSTPSFEVCRSELLTTALITMHGRLESIADARDVFDGADPELLTNVVVWTSMISAYVLNGMNSSGVKLFRRMLMEGVRPDAPSFNTVLGSCGDSESETRLVHETLLETGLETSISTGVALITAYSKLGLISESRAAFEAIAKKNLIVRTSLISAYAHNNHGKLGLREFLSIDLEGLRPDPVTFIAALDAAAAASEIAFGKLIHEEVRVQEHDHHPQLCNALLSLYSKCGCVDEATAMFEKLPEMGLVSGSAMLAGYAQNGHGRQALSFFSWLLLQGIRAEGVAFLSVLSACSHAGMIEQGRGYFAAMRPEFEIECVAEHFTCMVDLLARSGKLEEAEELIESMPFEPEALSWMSLLAGCKSYGHVERGRRAARRAMELTSAQAAAPYILLSSVH